MAEKLFLYGELTRQIIGAAIEVHRVLGPGLLESTYERCLVDEIQRGGVRVDRQVDVPVEFKGSHLDCGYRIDLVVADRVIVELKSIERILPIHEAQLMTYLRLAHKRVGLIINFNVTALRHGIVRKAL